MLNLAYDNFTIKGVSELFNNRIWIKNIKN
jgi:hypothetical protein